MTAHWRALVLVAVVALASLATWVVAADDPGPCLERVNVTEENAATVGLLRYPARDGSAEFYGIQFGDQYLLPPEHPQYQAYISGTPVALAGCS